MGVPAFQSSTSGINLIMTANDKAYGGVATHLWKDTTSTCYIKDAEKLTFVEKDSIYRARAFEWIKENPGRYAKLYFLKIGGLFVEDSWADRPILGGAGTFGVDVGNGGLFSRQTLANLAVRAAKSVVYYAICVLALVWLIKNFKRTLKNYRKDGLLLLLLLMGVCSTCLLTVSPRYHYPFMFILVIFAADYLTARKQTSSKGHSQV